MFLRKAAPILLENVYAAWKPGAKSIKPHIINKHCLEIHYSDTDTLNQSAFTHYDIMEFGIPGHTQSVKGIPGC